MLQHKSAIRVSFKKDIILVPDYKTHIEFRNGQITIASKIYGIYDTNYRDIKLVLDTGATISGISKNLAVELGYDLLQHSTTQDFDTAGGTQSLSIITVKQIDFAGSQYREHKILCNEHFDNMFIDGVIGLDILMNYNIDINFDGNFIEFYRRHKGIDLTITP